MVQTAGFDPSVIPAGPSEGRRQPEREPDSNRITPVDETEELRADRRRGDAAETPAVEAPTRIAFTAKFGPDEDGFPLQIVRGEDLVGAERIDFQVITERRISRADREVLLRAQEEQSAAVEPVERRQTVETTPREEERSRSVETSEGREEDRRAGLRLDLEV